MIEKIAQYLVDQLYIKPDDQILDIGCGEGELTRALGVYCGSVTGIDQDEKAIGKAMELSADNVNFITGDAYYLSQKLKGEYDKIVCYATFQYFWSMENGQNMLKTIATSLADDGAIFLGDIPNQTLTDQPFHLEEASDLSYGICWTPEEIAKIGKAVGLRGYQVLRPKGLLTSNNRFDFMLKKE